MTGVILYASSILSYLLGVVECEKALHTHLVSMLKELVFFSVVDVEVK
jgi:hypothetical protein